MLLCEYFYSSGQARDLLSAAGCWLLAISRVKGRQARSSLARSALLLVPPDEHHPRQRGLTELDASAYSPTASYLFPCTSMRTHPCLRRGGYQSAYMPIAPSIPLTRALRRIEAPRAVMSACKTGPRTSTRHVRTEGVTPNARNRPRLCVFRVCLACVPTAMSAGGSARPPPGLFALRPQHTALCLAVSALTTSHGWKRRAHPRGLLIRDWV
jgi:hypothetical protein